MIWKIPSTTVDMFVEDYEAGISIVDIAYDFDVGELAVTKNLKKRNVWVRKGINSETGRSMCYGYLTLHRSGVKKGDAVNMVAEKFGKNRRVTLRAIGVAMGKPYREW